MTHATKAISIAVLLGLAGCVSEESGQGGEGGQLACTEPEDTLTDSDCEGTPHPRKLDCSNGYDQELGLDRHCVPEDPTDPDDFDLCCPINVRGTREVTLGCTEPPDTLTDSDCQGTPRPRKLDCVTADEQQAGIDLGCAPEDGTDAADFDLCCPEAVRGSSGA